MKNFILAVVTILALVSCDNRQKIKIAYGPWESTETLMKNYKDEIANRELDKKYKIEYMVADDTLIIQNFLKGNTDILVMENGVIATKCGIVYENGNSYKFELDFSKRFAEYTNIPLNAKLINGKEPMPFYELLWIRKDLNITNLDDIIEYSKNHPLVFAIDAGYWERFNLNGTENYSSGKRWVEYSKLNISKYVELSSYDAMFTELDRGGIDIIMTMDWVNAFNHNVVCLQSDLVDQGFFYPQTTYFMCRKNVPNDIIDIFKMPIEYSFETSCNITDTTNLY